MSAYLPAKVCKDHIVEYQETIDQLFESIQKYNSTHQILIGGDINEDLNQETGTVRNNYIQDFISDCNLTYSVTGKTFVNSCGQDSAEIDYFLHNIPGDSSTTKEILDAIPENTSDHYPIKMSIFFKYKHQSQKTMSTKATIRKGNWDKVDKDWYQVIVTEGTEKSLQNYPQY